VREDGKEALEVKKFLGNRLLSNYGLILVDGQVCDYTYCKFIVKATIKRRDDSTGRVDFTDSLTVVNLMTSRVD